jgi:cyclic pyranopterin phosphate synthase
MNDVDFPVADVLAGIEAAQQAGLQHIKVNMVVKRGTNDDQILPMARHFRGTGITLRFIEYMDVGATNGWRMDEVLPSAEVIALLQRELPLVPLEATPRRNRPALGLCRRRRPPRPSLGRSGRDQQRDPGFLPRLQPRPPVHRRPALHLPVCRPGLGPAHPAAQRQRRAAVCGHSRHLARPHDRYSELRSQLPPRRRPPAD